MEQSSYWNIYQKYHPKDRLLKYTKSSKISSGTLGKLSNLRKIYRKLPPIVYSLQDHGKQENDDITLEYDIFGQQCNLPMQNIKYIWQSTSFSVPDRVYRRLKGDLFSSKIDSDSVFLCLFPIYADMNHRKQPTMGRQDEEIFLASTIPNTQYDLYQLQERFQQKLYDEHALEIGLCPKRRRIYNDFFDELIRIIFLQCSERGLLLARIKNEHLQWMNTYEELYSSGMAYGLREYLRTVEEKENDQFLIERLEIDCQELHAELDRESIRYEKLTELITNDDVYEQNSEQRLLKSNVNILRSTNEILRRDLQNTLDNILSSTIFLGEPIDYDKESN